jgi:hypothetical protein
MSVKDEEGDLSWPTLDDGPGPARPLDGEAARRLVHAALDAPRVTMGAEPPNPREADVLALPVNLGGTPRPPAPRARRRPALSTLLLVAAILAIAAVAAAAVVIHRLTRPSGSPAAAVTAPLAVSSPPVAVSSVLTPEPAPSASDAPSLPPEPSSGPPRPVPHAVSADPSALLEQANRLRAQKKWREAEAAYQRVIQVSPSSAEAQSARVAAAALRLEQLHDPQGAERLFGQAERQGGALSEEAAWGLCETRRARGDREGEARALGQFLRSFPEGVMAPRARARLAEISSPTP